MFLLKTHTLTVKPIKPVGKYVLSFSPSINDLDGLSLLPKTARFEITPYTLFSSTGEKPKYLQDLLRHYSEQLTMRIDTKQYAGDGPIVLHHITGILRVKAGKVTVESNYNLIRTLLIPILLVFQQYVNVLPFFFLMPLTTSKSGLL